MMDVVERKLPAKIEYLHDALDFITEISKQQGIGRDKINNIQVVVEEIFVNICRYSYDNDNKGIIIKCKMSEDGFFCIDITDWGKPFNILDSTDPHLNKNIDERNIGGLGIWIVKNLTDRINYKRIDDSNILEIGFKIK